MEVRTVTRVRDELSRRTWIPLLLIRLFLGYMFLQTGWSKVHKLDEMAQQFAEWGIIWPSFNAALSSYTELIGGGLLMLGLFTRLVSIPLAINMIVATLAVQMKDIDSFGAFFTLNEPLYALIFIGFVFAGPGKASLDHLIERYVLKSERRDAPSGTRTRAHEEGRSEGAARPAPHLGGFARR
jgi:putative oxidoreductase